MSSLPQRRNALTTSVFCTSTRTPTDGSTRDSSSTASTEWKKCRRRRRRLSGISIPMTPSSNSLSTSERGIFACSSISRTSGRTWASANCADAVAKDRFVFGQQGQRLAVSRAVLARCSLVCRRASVIGTKSSMLSSGYAGPRSSSSRPALGVLGSVRPGRAAAAAARRRSSRRPAAAAGSQPAGRQRPPVIRSGINFVSVDVIVTDKKTGDVVLDMKQDDFEVREDKKPQKVDTFDMVKIDRARANRRSTPTRDPQHRSTRRTRRSSRTSACSSCCSTTITCGAATTSRRESR